MCTDRPSGTVGWPWNSRPVSPGRAPHSPRASSSPAAGGATAAREWEPRAQTGNRRATSSLPPRPGTTARRGTPHTAGPLDNDLTPTLPAPAGSRTGPDTPRNRGYSALDNAPARSRDQEARARLGTPSDSDGSGLKLTTNAPPPLNLLPIDRAIGAQVRTALRAPGGPGASGPRSTPVPWTTASQRIFHWPPLHPDIRTGSRASPRHPSRFLFPSKSPNGQWGPDQPIRHKDARRTETAGPRLGQRRQATGRARTYPGGGSHDICSPRLPVTGPWSSTAQGLARRLARTAGAPAPSTEAQAGPRVPGTTRPNPTSTG